MRSQYVLFGSPSLISQPSHCYQTMAGRLQTIPYFHAVETLDDTSMELERDHYLSMLSEGLNAVLEPDEWILLRYHSRDDAIHRERQRYLGQFLIEREVDALTKIQLQKHAAGQSWQAQLWLMLSNGVMEI